MARQFHLTRNSLDLLTGVEERHKYIYKKYYEYTLQTLLNQLLVKAALICCVDTIEENIILKLSKTKEKLLKTVLPVALRYSSVFDNK